MDFSKGTFHVLPLILDPKINYPIRSLETYCQVSLFGVKIQPY